MQDPDDMRKPIDGDAVRLLIADHLGVRPDEVTGDASFRDLGADSLDLVSLTMRIEESFDVIIPDGEAETCLTVGNALALLAGARHAPRPSLAAPRNRI